MILPTITLVSTALDRDGICASQNPAAAGNLTINGALASGGTVTNTFGRLVTVYGAGNESAHTFTVYGTDENGVPITEDIAGPNAGTTTSTKYFKTITRVYVDGDAGAVEVGIAVGCASPRIVWNERGELPIRMQFDHTATCTYTLQHSISDLKTGGSMVESTGWASDADIVDETSDQNQNITFPVVASRVILTAWSGSGQVIIRGCQFVK